MSQADRRSDRRVAAFDFDGTLVDGDSLIPFLAWVSKLATPTALSAPPSLPSPVAARLGQARLLARTGSPMLKAYRSGGREAAKVAILARTVKGLPVDQVASAGATFGSLLATRIRPEMAEKIRWHREQGHMTVLVSASLTTYLNTFASHMGIDKVVATELEVGPDQRLTGRILGANVRGEEKARRLTEVIDEAGGASELWAYGDSSGDDQMLAMADHPERVSRGITKVRHKLGRVIESRGRRPGESSSELTD